MTRRKILRIGSSFLPCLLGRDVQPYEITRDPLPPDTRIVNARMGDDFRTLILLLESSEFEEVPEDSPYPEITPLITAIERPELATAEPASN